MLMALFRIRLRAALAAVLLSVAAPRVAHRLREFGHDRRQAGRNSLTWRVPTGAADLLDRLSGRPARPRSRWSRLRRR
jgi:hypothetical protein